MPCSKGKNGRLRLFFFPHAGGGASTFYHWARELPAAVDSYAIQLPGRETRLREPVYQQVPPLVQTLAKVLTPFLDKPFVFWGHSMGAMLSFELIRVLQQKGKPLPQRLIVSGYNAPHIPYADPPLHHLPQQEFGEALYELNGTQKTVLQNAELWDLLFPILRADFQLVETYTYEESEPLLCPITVLDGLSDEKTNEADLQAWQKQSVMPLEMFTFPGNHFFLYERQPAVVDTIIGIINHQLSQI